MINCGTDIVKISRLEKALETPGFYEKVFGKRGGKRACGMGGHC